MIATAAKADPVVPQNPQLMIGLIAAIVLGSAVAGSSIEAADKFHRLNGGQIRSEVAGQEMTDNVHWRDFYDRNGTLVTQSMGRKKTGTWRVEKNELCVERGANDGGCYEVWISKKKVELRRAGLDVPVLDGVLQRPTKRE